jgi:uncharacterized protein YodC (DUF2158 family)
MGTGDVVRLKSGGPRMTLVEVAEHEIYGLRVWCEWFGEKKMPQKGDFAPTLVERAPAQSAVVSGVRSARGPSPQILNS